MYLPRSIWKMKRKGEKGRKYEYHNNQKTREEIKSKDHYSLMGIAHRRNTRRTSHVASTRTRFQYACSILLCCVVTEQLTVCAAITLVSSKPSVDYVGVNPCMLCLVNPVQPFPSHVELGRGDWDGGGVGEWGRMSSAPHSTNSAQYTHDRTQQHHSKHFEHDSTLEMRTRPYLC